MPLSRAFIKLNPRFFILHRLEQCFRLGRGHFPLFFRFRRRDLRRLIRLRRFIARCPFDLAGKFLIWRLSGNG